MTIAPDRAETLRRETNGEGAARFNIQKVSGKSRTSRIGLGASTVRKTLFDSEGFESAASLIPRQTPRRGFVIP